MLKKNKVEIPTKFVPNKTRATNNSKFAFKEVCTLVSYVTKKKINMLKNAKMSYLHWTKGITTI